MSAKNHPSSPMWRIDAIGVTAICALTALAYVVIIQPISRHQSELVAMRSELATSRNKAALSMDAHNRLSGELFRVRQAITVSPVRLEPVDQLNQRLASIVGFASRSGLVIDESRAGAVKSGIRFDEVPVELVGGGSYPSCARFLHLIASDVPDVEVLGLELSGSPGVPGSNTQFRFQLVWYATPLVASGARETANQP